MRTLLTRFLRAAGILALFVVGCDEALIQDEPLPNEPLDVPCRLVAYRDGDGNHEFVYDGGRLKVIRHFSSQGNLIDSAYFIYDNSGKIVKAVNNKRGDFEVFSYDGENIVTSEIHLVNPFNQGVRKVVVNFTYAGEQLVKSGPGYSPPTCYLCGDDIQIGRAEYEYVDSVSLDPVAEKTFLGSPRTTYHKYGDKKSQWGAAPRSLRNLFRKQHKHLTKNRTFTNGVFADGYNDYTAEFNSHGYPTKITGINRLNHSTTITTFEYNCR